ncbi:MAG: 1-acyl-sn-glycerol-3-phosphate acyltransferase [Prolixibacteraceae bacterium]|nr:1-acyl-sn-glycerol-3-phosphate acyltransferase [Prolixibacteraceae bacterium]
MRKSLFSDDELCNLSPLFRSKAGLKLARIIMSIIELDKVNALYERCSTETGPHFANNLLNDVGVNYSVGNIERLKAIQEGPFISVSNHPYGGIDGIMLVDLLGGFRSDFKIMVNNILSMIEAMDQNFISVLPKRGNKAPDTRSNMQSIKETLNHIKGGHPVGFFPSGAVSLLRLKDFRIRDRQWQESVLKIIHSVKVPILPVRFFDKNSTLFYLLGLIDWRIRQFRMPHEVFNKSNKQVRIGIGNIITPEEQAAFKDARSLGNFIYNEIYKMPLPDNFIPRSQIDFNFKSLSA